jgi:hypothetical protein
MNPNARIMALNQLQTGDVLLCVMGGRLAAKVEHNTESKYTHAGICYNEVEVVDVTLGGIQKAPAAQFVAGSEYVAVFRNPYIWNQNRVQAFHRFMDNAINARRKYDRTGARTFAERKEDHKLTLLAKLYEHFENGLQPVDHNKLKYICSELVVAAFIEIGFIQPSAAIAYQCDTYSPGDLGRDPTFGFFVGYLKPETTEEIPADDEFANKVTLGELKIAEDDMIQEILTGRTRLV